MSTSDKWDKEKKAAKAVQVAFDLGQEVSHHIRYEALEKGINPPDRIREILGLPVNSRPVRPRLSISLSENDFMLLAEKFGVEASDRLRIRQIAAEKLVAHLARNEAD
ncbi:MAG: hypothetical protein QGH99_10305 [Pseudomonadales bacterium]|jgi:hypothetical protein|nr:hypothetical protein [Pseudomonadales bacterium]|tara:strand:+ start:965 stop:1288 length:324 start_codon:yes stop_codon:yes gene_type:complete